MGGLEECSLEGAEMDVSVKMVGMAGRMRAGRGCEEHCFWQGPFCV